MTYKSHGEYICDQCGKRVPADEANWGLPPKWFVLHQELAAPVAGVYDAEDLGDFCTLACLQQFLAERWPTWGTREGV